jgi:hypothetical protein
MKILSIGAAIAALTLGAVGVASAGGAPATPAKPAARATVVLGKHTMPGKVTKVDHHSGMVDVDSYGMHLVVHFPPRSIAGLKTGDPIVLHLGYSKAR